MFGSNFQPRVRGVLAYAVGVVSVLSAVTVATAPPASADNPPCPTDFVSVLQHIYDGHVAGKVCYRESTDNWKFQDTYPNDMGVNLRVPTDANLGAYRWIDDKDGSNNGWILVYSEYPEDRTIWPGMCSIDYETGTNYGCTTTNVLT